MTSIPSRGFSYFSTASGRSCRIRHPSNFPRCSWNIFKSWPWFPPTSTSSTSSLPVRDVGRAIRVGKRQPIECPLSIFPPCGPSCQFVFECCPPAQLHRSVLKVYSNGDLSSGFWKPVTCRYSTVFAVVGTIESYLRTNIRDLWTCDNAKGRVRNREILMRYLHISCATSERRRSEFFCQWIGFIFLFAIFVNYCQGHQYPHYLS
jgi:hypothetical protein